MSRRLICLFLPAALLAAVPLVAEQPAKPDRTLKPTLRTRVETFKGSGAWDEAMRVADEALDLMPPPMTGWGCGSPAA